MIKPTGLIVAIDTPDAAHAFALARAVAGPAKMVKLGLEFFAAHGPDGIARVTTEGLPFFLDLKLHDIPNTVAGAVAALAPLRPALLTVHAGGGAAMVAAAVAASGRRDDPARPRVLAVTVLTSLDNAALAATGVADASADQVVRLARLAMAAGADGIVCGPHEVAAVRAAIGPSAVLVVPGVRPVGSEDDDQARFATPAEAARAGADWIVVGRPITRAPDPGAAARAIAAELVG